MVVQGHLVDVAAAPAVVVDDRHPVAEASSRGSDSTLPGRLVSTTTSSCLRLDPQEGIIAAEEGP
ncbi:MAG: hypothetical protein ACLUYZ_02545 [Lachnospiraceae bacterium]